MTIPLSIKALSITADGEVTDIDLHVGSDNTMLGALYEAIECDTIDRVILTGKLHMWLDDNGWGTVPMNPVATYIARHFGYTRQPYFGTVVFTGGDDDRGTTVSITPELTDQLRSLLGGLR